MSAVALALATKTYLHTNFKQRDGSTALDVTICDIMPDGQPPAVSGEEFIAIWINQWDSPPCGPALHELMGLNITYSRKMGYAPSDRWGTESLNATTSFLVRAEALRAMLATYSVRLAIMNAANVLLDAAFSGTQWAFAVPFRFAGVVGAIPEKKYGDWFGGDGESTHAAAGLSVTFALRDAERAQEPESFT